MFMLGGKIMMAPASVKTISEGSFIADGEIMMTPANVKKLSKACFMLG